MRAGASARFAGDEGFEARDGFRVARHPVVQVGAFENGFGVVRAQFEGAREFRIGFVEEAAAQQNAAQRGVRLRRVGRQGDGLVGLRLGVRQLSHRRRAQSACWSRANAEAGSIATARAAAAIAPAPIVHRQQACESAPWAGR